MIMTHESSHMVSVLMSVFNAETYLKEAVDSILNQTFRDFEFIIIDDASTDKSSEIIHSYQDNRIKLVKNEQNIGLTRSLNKGIQICRGKYIARMDADDIAYPSRLEKQLAFMENHPRVGVCGSWVHYLQDNKKMLWRYPVDNDTIKIELLFRNRIAHPSAMLRRSVLMQHHISYNIAYYTSQDYELWVRLSDYCALANLPEPLTIYRHHQQRVSSTKKKQQRKNTHYIRLYQLQRLDITPTWREWKTHLEWINQVKIRSIHTLKNREAWFNQLQKANQKKKIYRQPSLDFFLAKQWQLTVSSLTTFHLNIFYLCIRSPFFSLSGFRKTDLLTFLWKCIKGSIQRL